MTCHPWNLRRLALALVSALVLALAPVLVSSLTLALVPTLALVLALVLVPGPLGCPP